MFVEGKFIAMDNCANQSSLQKALTKEAEGVKEQQALSQLEREESDDDSSDDEKEKTNQDGQSEIVSVQLVGCLPTGDGCHNNKTMLVTARNPLLWQWNGGIYLISVTNFADLVGSCDKKLSEEILECIPASILTFLDKQNTKNITDWTSKRVIDVSQ